jgi:hypothetical protein
MTIGYHVPYFGSNLVKATLLLVRWWRSAKRVEIRWLTWALRVGSAGGTEIRSLGQHHAPERITLHALAAAHLGELLQIAQAKLFAQRVDAKVAKRVEATVKRVPQLPPGIENHVVVV